MGAAMVAGLDDDDAADLARAQRRAAFLEGLGPEPLADVAAKAIDECATAVEASLKLEPARGVEEGVSTAWAEAAAIAQANSHDLRELLVQELHGLAANALARLAPAQRRALWACLEPHECDRYADLWERPGSEAFDPLGAWPGSLDEAERHVVGRVLDALAQGG